MNRRRWVASALGRTMVCGILGFVIAGQLQDYFPADLGTRSLAGKTQISSDVTLQAPNAVVTAAPGHHVAVHDGRFYLDDMPFQIISGEMHYPRIPRAYWRDRLRMAKAMGLNAITTYVFWNVHEPRPGEYDFSGQNDVAEFIREAQEEGLYVILRPGPYVCAEWEFGGLPAWLLKDKSLVVRSGDPKFLAAAGRWMNRLGKELAAFQVGRGGPILLVQVENEYGSFGADHAYMDAIRKIIVDAGFTESQLYTADGADRIADGSLPDLPVGINLGADNLADAKKNIDLLRRSRRDTPVFCSELWDGWFDHWGHKHHPTDTAKQTETIRWLLRQGYSLNLYMFHGGTSFGWMNGANYDDRYLADITSYDYDAPLDESGRSTPRYFAYREAIATTTGMIPPPVPATSAMAALPEIKLTQSTSLWNTLRIPVHSAEPLSMEDLGQAYGYILYRTNVQGPIKGTLALNKLQDYAQVYLDQKLLAALDRRLAQSSAELDVKGSKAQLDILVENSGRLNFGSEIQAERKGITESVTLAGKPLIGWDVFPLPMLQPSKLKFHRSPCEGACFYRYRVKVSKPGDTFLDTRAFTKGMVWLNGHPLGRAWNIGPQQTLYVPGPWLRKGENEVVVFDLQGKGKPALSTRNDPIRTTGMR